MKRDGQGTSPRREQGDVPASDNGYSGAPGVGRLGMTAELARRCGASAAGTRGTFALIGRRGRCALSARRSRQTRRRRGSATRNLGKRQGKVGRRTRPGFRKEHPTPVRVGSPPRLPREERLRGRRSVRVRRLSARCRVSPTPRQGWLQCRPDRPRRCPPRAPQQGLRRLTFLDVFRNAIILAGFIGIPRPSAEGVCYE